MSDWSKAKARQVIDNQIAFEGKSQMPSQQSGEGMIQLAYSLGLLTDQELQDLSDQLADTVKARRKQLRDNHNAALLGQAVPHD